MPIPASHYLARQRFGFAELVAAAGVPAPRLAQWLKTGAFTTLEPVQTGTGNRREFGLWDVYGVRLFAALTDTEQGLGLALKTASAIVRSAIIQEDAGAAASIGDKARYRAHVRDGITARRAGTFFNGEDVRDPSRHLWLIGARVRFADPDISFWRGVFQLSGEHPRLDSMPNPRRSPPQFIALDAMPHLIAADRALIEARGLVALFPEEPSE